MISGVHISTSEMVITKDDIKKSSLPRFIKNQIIRAKVIDILPNGRAVLSVGGKEVTARAPMLLTPGEAVQLKVIQEKSEVVLKLVEPGRQDVSKPLSSLVRFLSETEPLKDISETRLGKAAGLVMETALKSDKADPDFLPRLIEKGGVLLETKMARIIEQKPGSSELKMLFQTLTEQDVKALVLKELFQVGSERAAEMKTAAGLPDTLETFQQINQQTSESGRFLLPFPVFSESAFRFGQLFIDTGASGNRPDSENDRMIKISFLLDMTRLGPLRADFSILKKEISGGFLFSDQERCDYVRSLIPALQQSLIDKEYQVHRIDCRVAQKEQLEPGSLIESLVRENKEAILNIVV